MYGVGRRLACNAPAGTAEFKRTTGIACTQYVNMGTAFPQLNRRRDEGVNSSKVLPTVSSTYSSRRKRWHENNSGAGGERGKMEQRGETDQDLPFEMRLFFFFLLVAAIIRPKLGSDDY